MPAQNLSISHKTHYPVVIISDTHLGMRNASTDLLCEFLEHISCDTLILNGDIVDGRRINRRAPKDMPEMHKRVLDAVYRHQSEGADVVYTSGNHDDKLRSIHQLSGQSIGGIRLEYSLDLTDKQGRKLYVSHGDAFDSLEANIHKIPHILHLIADYAYIAITTFSNTVNKYANILLHTHMKPASRFNHVFDTASGALARHRTMATAYAEGMGYHGIICGHTHVPAIKTNKKGTLYLNSGDWVENFSALAMDSKGDWSIIKWPKVRQTLGLKRYFNPASKPNPNQRFRPMTEKFLEQVRELWPGRPQKRNTAAPSP